MFRIITWMVVCTFYCVVLLAEDEGVLPSSDLFSSSLVKTQSLISTMVQSVSTVSGEWLHAQTDFVVMGPKPIILNRYYAGDQTHCKRLGYNWSFSHPQHLIINSKDKEGHGHFKTVARLKHGIGLTTIHETETKPSNEDEVHILPIKNTNGLTNCFGEMSAKTNLHNIYLHYDHKAKKCTAVNGQLDIIDYQFVGTKNLSYITKTRFFGSDHPVKQYVDAYHPIQECKANGNRFSYPSGKIESTDSTGKVTYGSISFKSDSLDKLEVIASDGRTGLYTYNLYQHVENSWYGLTFGPKRYSLSSATFKHKPSETYEYTESGGYDGMELIKPLLKARRLPNGRFQEVEYYGKEHNIVDMQVNGQGKNRDVKIDSRHDFNYHRVKHIKAPVGFDQTPIITHRFFYEANGSPDKGDQNYSGITKVYDAYLRKTEYAYNHEHRPTSIKRYDNKKKLDHEECYVWECRHAGPSNMPNKPLSSPPYSTKDLFRYCSRAKMLQTPSKGNLQSKYIKDGNGKVKYVHYFDYDPYGNITLERLIGDLSGTKETAIVFNTHDKPMLNNLECYEKHFTYSDEQFNLLITEEEDNGKGIQYDYYPETSLVKVKYVTAHGKICLRQFYHYDAYATLIKIIKDNGTEKEEENIEGTTERHITYFYPTTTPPLGLPSTIEYKYVNPKSKKEILLKKLVNHYTIEGYLQQQDRCDEKGTLYSLYWDYDVHGNQIKEVNALGHTINKRYDENDNLVYEQGPRAGDVKNYNYDFSNRLVCTQHEADGHKWETHHRYDLVGNRIADIDRYGNETTYTYDHCNRLISTTYPPTGTNQERSITKKEYDCLGNTIAETDARGYKTAKKYNARGKVIQILHPDGQQESFEYDLDGTLAKKIASNETTTEYAYDCFGRTLSEKALANGDLLYETFNTFDSMHRLSSTDASGVTTTFTYDDAGRLIKTTILDHTEEYTYDTLGRIIKKTENYEAGAKVTCYAYDFLDHLIEERIENEKSEVLKKVTYQYDLLGNRTHVNEHTQQGSSLHITDYNQDKKPTRIVDPLGHETHIAYDYYHKNPYGQFVLQTTVTDPLGRQTLTTHDTLGRPVAIQTKDSMGVLLAHQELSYDLNGNVISYLDHVIVDGKKTKILVAEMTYQEKGEITSLTLAKGLTEQQITRTKYNDYGQKSKIIKGDGTHLTYSYDALGRVESYWSNDQTIYYGFIYNQRHQPLIVKDYRQDVQSEFEYDDKGRLIREKLPTNAGVSYEYDSLDRVTALILPDASRVEYLYDAICLKEVQRTKNDTVLYTHKYETYDQAGLLLKETTINGQASLHTYDVCKRSVSNTNDNFSDTNLHYDVAGRLLLHQGKDPIGEFSTHYTYDNLNHLISEQGHVQHTYACDSLHNRTSKNEQKYTSNGLHQLISNGVLSYKYVRGNLVEKSGTENATYQYDALDRLTGINSSIHYFYDFSNRRIAKEEGERTLYYLYAGQDEIGVMDEQWEIQELRILGAGKGAEIGATVAIELKGRPFAPIHDYKGNIVCLTDLAGTPIETYRYTSFSETKIYNPQGNEISSSAIGNPWRFSSKRYDEETGFINFGRRYYDPANGRWITSDPNGLSDGPNLYAYLHHSPSLAIDLYGLQDYPLDQVNFHDHSDNTPQQQPENQNAPLGLMEKEKEKKDRLFFCGSKQLGSLSFGFVNGIMNSFHDVSSAAKRFSEMADDHFISFVYNRSRGFILFDMVRCFFELYFYAKTEAVQNLMNDINAKFAAIGPNDVIYLKYFSEGAIITRNAIMRTPEAYRKRIWLYGKGIAAYIDPDLVYKVTQARSSRDIVPFFDFVGAYRCRDHTTVLKPHPDAPFFDHVENSPTYRRSEERDLALYMQTFGDKQ